MEKNISIGGRLKGAANYLWREGTVYIILAALITFLFERPIARRLRRNIKEKNNIP